MLQTDTQSGVKKYIIFLALIANASTVNDLRMFVNDPRVKNNRFRFIL